MLSPRPNTKTIGKTKTQVSIVDHANQMKKQPSFCYQRPKQILASPRRVIAPNFSSPQILKKPTLKFDFDEEMEANSKESRPKEILHRFNSIVDTSLQERRVIQAVEYNRQKIEYDRIQKAQEEYLKQLASDNE